jgi:hypothetical protein
MDSSFSLMQLFFCVGTMDVDPVTPGLQARRAVSSQELSYL